MEKYSNENWSENRRKVEMRRNSPSLNFVTRYMKTPNQNTLERPLLIHTNHTLVLQSALSVVVDLKVQQTNTTLLYSKHSVLYTNVVINVQIYGKW